MGATQPACPVCGSALALSHNGSNIVCPNCGAAYSIPINAPGNPSLKHPKATPEGAEELLAELDEKIGELASDIESLRSREQGAPLELGCALFGVFGVIILVLALFATVARAYFGRWIFYLVLASVILAGLYRMAPKIMSRAELRRMARRRAEMEATLSRLRIERERLIDLSVES